jgi:phage host-nuclease inhibitor protein Gam
MSANFINLTDTIEEWRVKANAVYGTVGDLSTLSKNASVSYQGLVGENANDFTGTPATFNIVRTAGVYSVSIATGGSGYEIGDVVTIRGTELGGETPANDAVITIDSVDPGFAADAASIVGVAVADIISEVNALRSEQGDINLALTTNSETVRNAVNEFESVLRGLGESNYDFATDANNVVAAVNELENAVRGALTNYDLDTDASDLVSAINEFQAEIGRIEDFNAQGTSSDIRVTYVDLGNTIVNAVNSLKTKADLISDEMGGIMSADYDGPDDNMIDALNALYNRSDLGTLDNVYMRRNGSVDMTGLLELSDEGISSQDNNFLIRTGAGDITAVTINASNQNVGIGGAPGTHKVKVTGALNATTGLYWNGDSTDTRYVRTDTGSDQVVSIGTTFEGNLNLEPAVGNTLTIGGSIVTSDSYDFLEWTQDQIGGMFTDNSEARGISASYNDDTGKIDLAIANNSHNHVSGNITDFTEAVQDTVGNMFAGNTENGITLDYNDSTGKINVDVNDPVITISGEASGSATMSNLGNTNISVTLQHEAIQDAVGEMVSGNTETGLSVTYNDSSNKLDFALTSDPTIRLTGDASGQVTLVDLASTTFDLAVTVANDSHTHNTSTIVNFTENVQDIVGNMINPTNIEAGISVTYNDSTGKLDFNVNDPTITLSGDVTGTATMSNLGSINITTTVANDSHNHDGRYYTESEADSRFVNASGDSMSGKLTLAAGSSAGLAWPNNAYGGTGDLAGITLESSGSEATKMRFKMGNDTDDQFEFTAPSNDGLKMNGHAVLHDGNYTSRTIYRAQFYNQQSLSILNSSGSTLKTIYGAGG